MVSSPTGKIYIFDLDGTLALIDHRRPILSNKLNKNRWDDFYKACVNDSTHSCIMDIFIMLLDNNHNVHIWSGRSDLVWVETIEWMNYRLPSYLHSAYQLKMRPQGDFTPDEELKQGWLDELSQNERNRIACVFDDRDKIVAMWRSNGITCCQVASGGF